MNDNGFAPGPGDLARAEEFLERGSRGQGSQNLRSDRYDRRTFSELVEASGDAKELVGGGLDAAPPGARHLLLDLYLAYYAAQPELLEGERVEREARLLNRPFLVRMLEDKAFYDARLLTRLDEAASFLAALCAAEPILEELKKLPPTPESPSAPERKDLAPGTNERPSPADHEAPAREGEDDARGPDGAENAQAGEDGAEGEAVPVCERTLRRAARDAAAAAEASAADYAEALSSWGLEPADLARVPLADRLELVGRLVGKDLRRLAELAGRMRETARSQARASVRRRTDEVHSVTPGADLAKVLPSELVSLASPDPLRTQDFYRRLAEGEVLSYDLSADEDAAEGPIVLAIDCSWSMSKRGKMDWAVAVALAVVDLCSGRSGLPERRVDALFFNTRVVHEESFAPGERDPRKILSVACVGPSGGTDYAPALRRATSLVEASEESAADVLFVTDELCRLPDEEVEVLLAKKAALGFSVHAVLLGGAPAEQDGGGELSRYSDTVQNVVGPMGRPDDGEADAAAGGVFGRFL